MATLPLEAQCTHRAPMRQESVRRMAVVLGLTVLVMAAEAVGGYFARSLALLADAGHMLADVGALALAVFAARIAQRPATAERSFGLLRLEILAAFVNGALLVAIAVGIGIEAFRRFQNPPAVRAGLLVGVATVGLVANLAGAALLHRGHGHSLNQRAAYLHVLSDALGSLGAIAAGIIVLTTGWVLADPLISIGIALLILGGAWRLMKECVDILLEATPGHISLPSVHDRIVSVPGVESVHDLHVWTVTSGVVAMSSHLVVRNPSNHQGILEQVQDRMAEFGIQHVTVQVEADEICE
jgi:cobalt-zinc-cadmium efflux system protein